MVVSTVRSRYLHLILSPFTLDSSNSCNIPTNKYPYARRVYLGSAGLVEMALENVGGVAFGIDGRGC